MIVGFIGQFYFSTFAAKYDYDNEQNVYNDQTRCGRKWIHWRYFRKNYSCWVSYCSFEKTQLTTRDAEAFYSVHSERPFFGELVSFMTRGPIVAAILEKENAVNDFRTLIGSTNPAEASEGTIRKLYATSMGENAVHGSDSDENAALESAFHFSEREIF